MMICALHEMDSFSAPSMESSLKDLSYDMADPLFILKNKKVING